MPEKIQQWPLMWQELDGGTVKKKPFGLDDITDNGQWTYEKINSKGDITFRTISDVGYSNPFFLRLQAIQQIVIQIMHSLRSLFNREENNNNFTNLYRNYFMSALLPNNPSAYAL